MASLTGQTIAATYKRLLTIDSENFTADDGAKYIKDGDAGTSSVLSLSTTRVGIGNTAPTALLTVGAITTLVTDSTTAVTPEGMNLHITEASKYAMGIKNADASGDGLIIQAGDASDDYALRVEDYDSANDLLVVRGDGNVGIGTASPGYTLQLKGDATYISVIAADASEAVLLGTDSDGDGALVLKDKSANNKVHFTGNSGTANYINNGGNVGIGTTSPGENLTVAGADPGIWIQHDTVNENASGHLDFTESATAFGASGGYGFRILNDGDNEPDDDTGLLRIQSGNQTTVSDRLVVERDTGNVGIGITAPDAPLSVKSTGQSTVVQSYIKSSDTNHIIEFEEGGSSQGIIEVKNSSGGTAKIRLDGAGDTWFDGGDVGIGTTSPDNLLHIHSTSATAEIRISTDIAGNCGIIFETDADNASGDIFGHIGIDHSESVLKLVTGETFDASTNGMVIDSNGKVGIGTAAPAHKLHIKTAASGSADDITSMQIQAGDADENAALYFSTPTNGEDYAKGAIFFEGVSSSGRGNMQFCIDTATDDASVALTDSVMSLDGANGRMHVVNGVSIGANADANLIDDSTTGSASTQLWIGDDYINVTSDERIKKDIVNTESNGLAIINQFRVVDYTWNYPEDLDENNIKLNERGRWTGFLAQEAVAVAPYAVNAPRSEDGEIDNDSENIWGIRYEQLVPILAKAIQELSAKVTALENA